MSTQRSAAWRDEIEELYRSQGRELWALFYAHCGDPEHARDALQESFLRLHEHNGEPIRNLRAWLLRVGRNWLRDVARRQRIAAKPTEHMDALPLGATAEELESEELHHSVREALLELKHDDREVLVLRYSLNWSSIRIAETLGTTATAVDMRLSRARRRLAEILDRLGIKNIYGD